jgi:hypothetical protein
MRFRWLEANECSDWHVFVYGLIRSPGADHLEEASYLYAALGTDLVVWM